MSDLGEARYTHSVALPLINNNPTLALELFQEEPAIAELDWNFSSMHKSSPRIKLRVGAGLLSMLLEIHPVHAWLVRIRV